MMRTTIMVHGGPDIRASTGGTSGAPITIAIDSGDGIHEMIVFTNDYALSDKLAIAINTTVLEHAAEKRAEPAVEEAA